MLHNGEMGGFYSRLLMCPGFAGKGFSYIEMLIVVVIVGVVASVAIPTLSSSDSKKLNIVTHEVAHAIRFARSEAMRLGSPIGYDLQSSQQQVRIFSADTSSNPWTLLFDVYHPTSKKLYDIRLQSFVEAAVDTAVMTATFNGTCKTPNSIYFDRHGSSWCADPETVPVQTVQVTLTKAALTRTVKLNGMTGRVVVE